MGARAEPSKEIAQLNIALCHDKGCQRILRLADKMPMYAMSFSLAK
jgi:hypothetical protein